MKEEEKGKEDEEKEKAEKSAGKNETPNAQRTTPYQPDADMSYLCLGENKQLITYILIINQSSLSILYGQVINHAKLWATRLSIITDAQKMQR